MKHQKYFASRLILVKVILTVLAFQLTFIIRFNAVCPRNPSLLLERLKEDEFRQAQNRRSQTEARISILSNCFCGSPMKQKGFDNCHVHMGLSILSHNLWVLGRVKIAQEQARQQVA